MTRSGTLLTVILVAALTAFTVSRLARPAASPDPATRQTDAYDRVIKTKTLRCGYTIWPPYLDRDTNTGEMSGLFYDYLTELGRAYDLKIDWVADVPLADIPAALNSGRIDAFCAAIAAIPARALNMSFTRPVLYFPFYAYVRRDDARFDHDLAILNDPHYTLSTMEGEFTAILARNSYPKASLLEITGNQGLATLFLNVAEKKADVIFQEPGAFGDYDIKNPGILRKSAAGVVGVVPGAFPVALGDTQLQNLLNTGIDDLQNRLIPQRLFRAYKVIGQPDQDDKAYLPARGYASPVTD